MIKMELGDSEIFVSKIALGTVQFGLDYGFSKKKTQYEVDEILDTASSQGINFIDTAREYGDSENKIGNYLARNKNNFIVATKLKKLKKELNKGIMKDKIYDSIDKSLKALKLQKIDVLQLHQTDNFVIDDLEFWNTINSLKEEKTIDAFGVSVYELEETSYLMENYGDVIDFFQVPYNIFDNRFKELNEGLKKKSISLISRSTFLKGIITCEESDLPSELRELLPFKKQLATKANDLNISGAELALLYVFFSELISSTLLGVNSSKELEENMNAINKYKTILKEKILNIDISVKNEFLIDPRKWTFF